MTARAEILRIGKPLLFSWTLAWVVGLSILASIAINLRQQLSETELDRELALYATAAYGLTWFDENDQFHDELLKLEDDLAHHSIDIWIFDPSSPPVIYLKPDRPRISAESFFTQTASIMQSEQELYLSGLNSQGERYRLHAIPTYSDKKRVSLPKAIIATLADPHPSTSANKRFRNKILLSTLALGIVGLFIGLLLTRWSLKPALKSLREREYFLAAAAHEFRTPMAALRSICESGLHHDESPKIALQRMQPLLISTGKTVEDMLLFAQLDAGVEPLLELVRLDLLTETVLPEEQWLSDDSEPSIALLDSRLAAVAIQNLLANAQRYGGDRAQDIVVRVRDGSVTVQDKGPGFPPNILEDNRSRFKAVPSSLGAGIGLAIAKLIVSLHGGTLSLSNSDQGGAIATLNFSPKPAKT